jgi:F-type H+-transporting ATPase subunit epsilon
MAETSKGIHLTILTPEKTLFDQQVDSVVITAYDGEMGFLPRHAPLITHLGIGELRAVAAGETLRFAIHSGFARMEDDQLLVLADVAESPGEIDAQRAQDALTRAREASMKKGSRHEYLRAIQRARTRLKILPGE